MKEIKTGRIKGNLSLNYAHYKFSEPPNYPAVRVSEEHKKPVLMNSAPVHGFAVFYSACQYLKLSLLAAEAVSMASSWPFTLYRLRSRR